MINQQMKLLHQTYFLLWIALALSASRLSAAGRIDDEQASPPFEASVEAWILGLSDTSYRTRRESFLKLCDRSIPLDGWLEKESKSTDKSRSAIATWLKRLRRSGGTLAERAEMLRDYEALRNFDDSVLDRYIADGQWARLVELVSLLEPALRNQLLRKEGQLQLIIEKAWKSDNESVVPRLLELVLRPTERVDANRLWKSLGMPEEWQVSQNSNLPSVKTSELEADSKIDEAVALAEKSDLRNFVEPILIRSNRWDKWLSLDLKRTRISRLENIDHQRAGMLLLLGRIDEAELQLEKLLKGSEASEISIGSAILCLALGRNEEFESFLSQQSELASFAVMRNLGNAHAAFRQVGLDDLSMEAVQKWLDTKAYQKRRLSEDLDTQRRTKASPLADFAKLFFQIGLNAQGQLVDSYLIDSVMKRESEEGISAWTPLFRQWLNLNQRAKAIHHWKDYLIRHAGRRLKTQQLGIAIQSADEEGPFDVIYSDFRQSASLIFDHLLSRENNGDKGGDILADPERRNRSIELVIDQMEDLHAGRLPRDWHGQRPLLELRKAVHSKSPRPGNSNNYLIEIAKLFDSLGETQLAIESLDMCSQESIVNQRKAEYLIRLGQHDAASDILVEEFRNDASDIGLLVECIQALEHVGRFGEMDRYRIQALSSVLNDQSATKLRSSPELPTNRIVQAIMEQRLYHDKTELRTWLDEPANYLKRQYGELAKKDLTQAKQAGNYSRIDALLWIKYFWTNDQKDIRFPLALFGSAFQSLILEAIADGNRELADSLFRMAFRCAPQDIEMPIVVVPIAERVFGKELADQWFDLFYQPMIEHLVEFPDDTLIGNNTAWLAALCNRQLKKAQSLASKVVVSNPDPTYLDTLAEVEYRLGNVAKAIELSEQCLQIEPKDKQHREQLKRFRAGKP